MAAAELLTELQARPLLPILRGLPLRALPAVVPALLASGLRLLEVALNSDEALPSLRWLRERVDPASGLLQVGAGTVTEPDQLAPALEAGASFAVTPALRPEVLREAARLAMPVICGAMTPSEILAAYSGGAVMVKVFPSGALGPEYFRELQGPLPHVPLMAVGGVTLQNAAAFLRAGARALGVGGALQLGRWEDGPSEITSAAQAFLEQIARAEGR
jgi:2-dehydro-3-deoxyphosphogluconate aldolase/(4S)-4-hydroxy-2-oxoglutarate aldolase